MTEDIIYLDNNATTRPYPEVLETITPFFNERYGNPSSVHEVGRDAKSALDDARQTVASEMDAESPVEVLFVSCATEANTLAIRGTVDASSQSTNQIITSEVEHPSVLETCAALESEGKAEVHYLPVDENAQVQLEQLQERISEDTFLVSIMTANNEVGTLQPISQISELCSEYDALLHTDAVQTPGKVPVSVKHPDVDLLSLSAHKFHGPRGIGILYRKKGIDLEPILRGGGQERELRSGTEAVALAAGAATALQRANEQRVAVAEHVSSLRNELWKGLNDAFGDNVRLNTPLDQSLPNTLNVSFLQNSADKMLINLDLNGICVSAGSACHSGAIEVSHVLNAMGVSKQAAEGSVRISFGHNNSMSDVERVLELLTADE